MKIDKETLDRVSFVPTATDCVDQREELHEKSLNMTRTWANTQYANIKANVLRAELRRQEEIDKRQQIDEDWRALTEQERKKSIQESTGQAIYAGNQARLHISQRILDSVLKERDLQVKKKKPEKVVECTGMLWTPNHKSTTKDNAKIQAQRIEEAKIAKEQEQKRIKNHEIEILSKLQQDLQIERNEKLKIQSMKKHTQKQDLDLQVKQKFNENKLNLIQDEKNQKKTSCWEKLKRRKHEKKIEMEIQIRQELTKVQDALREKQNFDFQQDIFKKEQRLQNEVLKLQQKQQEREKEVFLKRQEEKQSLIDGMNKMLHEVKTNREYQKQMEYKERKRIELEAKQENELKIASKLNQRLKMQELAKYHLLQIQQKCKKEMDQKYRAYLVERFTDEEVEHYISLLK